MQLILAEQELCPHAVTCPYSPDCQGAKMGRGTKFTCQLVNRDGTFVEGAYRNPLDQTGKQSILMESPNA